MQSNGSNVINIEADEQQVRIDFRYSNRHGFGGWVRMNPKCFIRPAGTDLHLNLVEAIGIPLAPKKLIFRTQRLLHYYTLIFPPLDPHITEIDIIEDSEDAQSFNFYNIPLSLLPMSLTHSKNTVLKKIEHIAVELKAISKQPKSYNDELARLDEPLTELSEFLKLEKEEVAIFCIGLFLSIHSEQFCLAELRSFSHFTTFDFFLVKKTVKSLVKEGWLTKGAPGHHSREKLFSVPQKHMEALYNNACPLITKKEMDVYVATDDLNNLFRAHGDDELETEELLGLIAEYEEEYPTIQPFQLAKDLNLGTTEKLLLYYLVSKTALGVEVIQTERMVAVLFTSPAEKRKINSLLLLKTSVLFTENYIEFVNADFQTDTKLKITKQQLPKLFGEAPCFLSQDIDFTNGIYKLIKYEGIAEKTLFYNDSEQQAIASVTEFLKAENYPAIIKRLEENKMRPGLTILLHGYPGTGKTETIYQLARQTQRHILLVNISEIRDKYVGESEKRLKAVFETYKNSRKQFEQTPILLFNESDALIGRRITVESSVDQMNNAMQNILLQELEDFTGILMATTNLTANLDKAFERRFLYKIKYMKPSISAKVAIWRSQLPNLSNADAQALSEAFDFSGGQIENISRKLFLDTLLHGTTYSLADTLRCCEEELLAQEQGKKIGYHIH